MPGASMLQFTGCCPLVSGADHTSAIRQRARAAPLSTHQAHSSQRAASIPYVRLVLLVLEVLQGHPLNK